MTDDNGAYPWSSVRQIIHNGYPSHDGGRVTRRAPLVEQELPTLEQKLSSHTVFSGVRVTRSLVL